MILSALGSGEEGGSQLPEIQSEVNINFNFGENICCARNITQKIQKKKRNVRIVYQPNTNPKDPTAGTFVADRRGLCSKIFTTIFCCSKAPTPSKAEVNMLTRENFPTYLINNYGPVAAKMALSRNNNWGSPETQTRSLRFDDFYEIEVTAQKIKKENLARPVIASLKAASPQKHNRRLASLNSERKTSESSESEYSQYSISSNKENGVTSEYSIVLPTQLAREIERVESSEKLSIEACQQLHDIIQRGELKVSKIFNV